MLNLLSEFCFEDICVQYRLEESSGIVGLELVPVNWQGRRQPKNQAVDPLVQLMLRGDDFPPGFSNGHTMRNNGSVCRFRYQSQDVEKSAEYTCVITRLRSEEDGVISHFLTHYAGEFGVEVVTTFTNNGGAAVTLEMLSSFCLGSITPFIANDAPKSLILHRLRSKWSNEARLDSNTIEDLHLEPTWAGHGAFSEKFGQIGSMPVRKFFPFAAVEDKTNGVLWGAQIGCPSSWQIEAYRKDDGLCLSGGLADYDFGHWCKTLKTGESLQSPTAYLSVCQGDIDSLCSRLTRMQKRAVTKMNFPVQMPVVFNEFCTTWGQPSHQNIKNILGSLRGRNIDYFIIDAGWYADAIKGWGSNMGDWQVNDSLFPGGLESTVNAIRDAGLKPGIWFEAEVCGRDAEVFNQTEHLLKRNGTPVTAGDRRFWDMRDNKAIEYLNERVIGLLRKYRFEYVKIDYNESIGVGCDGEESLGEGLRQNMIASREFLKNIRTEIPNIVVENCSSGGHRLEPSLLAACQLASFSDAHEETEIPIIAANLHRAVLPEQSLIWAVLRKADAPRRLAWSLCATFLGVMCLSGDVYDLDAAQWDIVDKAIAFYRSVSHIIQDGTTVRHGTKVASYRHPNSWQAVERTLLDGREKLFVVHPFDDTVAEVKIGLDTEFSISNTFGADIVQANCKDGTLTVSLINGACAIHLLYL